jgi:hypothetical protein
MGILFGIGSICFALGSFPPYFEDVDGAIVASTFFIGSIFFTSASYIQFHETLRAPGHERRPWWHRLFGLRPTSPDWWSAVVQFVGTLLFNISTFAATRADFSVEHARRLIWAPDVGGSICFLIASVLACQVAGTGRTHLPDGPMSWWISLINLAGSIAFGIAAIASRYLVTTDQIANIRLVNVGTGLGALCFLAGAVLLPVQSARSRAARPDR